MIRPATLYGEAPKNEVGLDTKYFDRSSSKKKEITVHGGDQYRPFLHVNDMVDLYVFFIKKYKNIKSGLYNASSGNMKVIEKAKLISKIDS